MAERNGMSRPDAPAAPIREERALLKVISTAVQLLLGGKTFESWAQSLLSRLGEATGVSRAYLFENESGPGGETLTTPLFERVASGVPPPPRSKILCFMGCRTEP